MSSSGSVRVYADHDGLKGYPIDVDGEKDKVDAHIYQCAICLDTFTRPVFLLCLHGFFDGDE
ncbi:hypothetical protein C8J57DRAFT_1506081 [Mycena rebaudengoi]|nr:hypothetical protein C8J57DRAFT_1506081 [Mycena rebaudengoi]